MGKCNLNDCVAPISCHVHGGTNFEMCEHYISDVEKGDANSMKTKNIKPNIPWTGDWLRPNNLNGIALRNSPALISVVGKADAGKTSFLGMLYTLLLHGRDLNSYKFAGSKTLIGWDQLHFNLVLNKGKVNFPDPTPLGVNRIYHLAVKNQHDKLQDILFSDASGETFAYWSQNKSDENGANAKWAHEASDGFILFIDCEALVLKTSFAKNEVLDIAQQLSADLNNRPVAVVWSKSDKFDQIHPKISESIKERISTLFVNYKEINISNILGATPDEYVHKNNLQVVDWLLNHILIRERISLRVKPRAVSNDFFLTYRKK